MTEQPQNRPLSTADMAAARQQVAAAPDPDAADQNANQGQTMAAQGASADSRAMALLDESQAGAFRSRWALIQASFVDEPRSAVEQGDALVAELMQRLAEVFATERERLEQQWTTGSDVSTEDLRLALRRYRSFFDRLLSV